MQISIELRTESPENKVSILQTKANEVLSFAVFSVFLEINVLYVFSWQRKKLLHDGTL